MVTPRRQQGAILISVIATLALIAAIAYLLNEQTGMVSNHLAREREIDMARYQAEAGVRDALMQTQKFVTYPSSVSGRMIGEGSYQAKIEPTTGSPITITSIGTTGSAKVEVVRTYAIACPGSPRSAVLIPNPPATNYDSVGSPTAISESGASVVSRNYMRIDNKTADRYRALMKFDLTPIPKGSIILAATLTLNLVQFDPSMAGGNLIVSRVNKPWTQTRATWTNATSATDRWATPGGDFTLVDEASHQLHPSITLYQWNIALLVDGWVNDKFLNNGLILRTDKVGTGNGPNEFRLKRAHTAWPTSEWPRLEVKYCSK